MDITKKLPTSNRRRLTMAEEISEDARFLALGVIVMVVIMMSCMYLADKLTKRWMKWH